MPIYEYACASCHHQFECIQKMDAPAVAQCPQCSKDGAERLVSAAGFQLKGTGWYVTDFKDKKPNDKKTSIADTPSTATKSSSTESVSDKS